jgi:RNA polymerase sigma factor (sigma-70 family)
MRLWPYTDRRIDMNQPFSSVPSRSPKGFQTTHWSLVAEASADSQAALEELCAAYWPPLHWHLKRLGFEQAEAEDLTQAFFARVLEKRLLDAADVRRGRFRTFLLTALRRFIINEWKRDKAAKRGGNRVRVSLHVSGTETPNDIWAAHDVTPDRLFDRQWAMVVLQRAFQELESEHRAAGQQTQFEALAPFLTGDASGTYDELAEKLQTTSGALRMVASRMRARLREFIRAEIRKTVHSDAEVDDEIHFLFRALQP